VAVRSPIVQQLGCVTKYFIIRQIKEAFGVLVITRKNFRKSFCQETKVGPTND